MRRRLEFSFWNQRDRDNLRARYCKSFLTCAKIAARAELISKAERVLMSRLEELKRKKKALQESSEGPKDTKKTRRQIERGLDDLLAFKGFRRRRQRISTSQQTWNNEFKRSKFN